MILKLRQIIEAKGALERLSRREMPAKVSYRVSKALDKFDSILKQYNKAVFNYMKEHGKPNEDGGYKIPKEEKEKLKAFNEYHEALLDEPEELRTFKIQINMFPPDFEIPPGDLMAMEFLFEDAETDAELAKLEETEPGQ